MQKNFRSQRGVSDNLVAVILVGLALVAITCLLVFNDSVKLGGDKKVVYRKVNVIPAEADSSNKKESLKLTSTPLNTRKKVVDEQPLKDQE